MQRLFIERKRSVDNLELDDLADRDSHHSASAPGRLERSGTSMPGPVGSARGGENRFGGGISMPQIGGRASLTREHSMTNLHRASLASDGYGEDIASDYDDYDGEVSTSLKQGSMATDDAHLSHADDMDLMGELIEYLRLLCEGHFLENQNYLRHQSDNLRSYNMLDEIASYLRALQWVINPYTNKAVWNLDLHNANLCHRILRCLVEFVQGNEENQVALAQHQLIFCLNDIFRQPVLEPLCAESTEKLRVIKGEALLLLFSLLEGCTDTRVASLLTRMCDFDAILDFLRGEEQAYLTAWTSIEKKSQASAEEAKYSRMAARHQPVFNHRRGSIAIRAMKSEDGTAAGMNEVVENVLNPNAHMTGSRAGAGAGGGIGGGGGAGDGDDGGSSEGTASEGNESGCGCCGATMMGNGEESDKKDLVARVKLHKEVTASFAVGRLRPCPLPHSRNTFPLALDTAPAFSAHPPTRSPHSTPPPNRPLPQTASSAAAWAPCSCRA